MVRRDFHFFDLGDARGGINEEASVGLMGIIVVSEESVFCGERFFSVMGES